MIALCNWIARMLAPKPPARPPVAQQQSMPVRCTTPGCPVCTYELLS